MHYRLLLTMLVSIECSVAARIAAQRQAATPPPALVPIEARALIVRVDSWFGQAERFAAGIVVGADERAVYIATARHAAYGNGDTAATALIVVFPPPYDTSVPATLHAAQDKDLDFAIIVIPRTHSPAIAAALASFDRVGDVRLLGFGTSVVAVGCPASDCWKRAATPDRIVLADDQRILFDTQKAVRGASGGGLFNERWEIVAMTLEHDGALGRANTIAPVLERMRELLVPVGLHTPTFPRAGYPMVVTLSLLTPAASSEKFSDGSRLPSGRVSVMRRRSSPLSWHGALTRLAPRDLGVTAGTMGASAALSAGRFSLAPFAEVGLARVEGRFDAGGVEVILPDGSRQHQPRWQQVRSDGIGIGFGGDVQAMVVPHVMIDVVAGHWDFPSPSGAPRLPSLFVGAGLRVGR